jgi:hypothetical protein
VLKTTLKIGLIIDPAPKEFFERRVLKQLASNFRTKSIEMDRDEDSLFNSKILTIAFDHEYNFATLMHKLTVNSKFKMQNEIYTFVSPQI